MSHGTASSSSSRSIPRPALPPSLQLATSQENNDSSDRPEGSQPITKSFSRAVHHVVFPRWFGTVSPLEGTAEATVGDKNAVRNTRTSRNSTKHTATVFLTPRSSTSSTVSQLTASHISTPRSPTTSIASFPPLNASNIPPRSPTNKSPFSAVLLVGEDEESEEDDPMLALWHTEQLHRARLAKLTKHLGEEIPAELVPSPTFPSHETSYPSVRSRHGGYHKRRSHPLSLKQESASEETLQRRKSPREQGDTHRSLSMIAILPKVPNTGHITGRVHSVGTITNIANGGVLHERVSMDTYPDGLLSHSSRPSVESCSETPPFSLHASCILPNSETLRQQPVTADAGRRIEKLANFFGVNRDDVSAAAKTAQKLQVSSTSTTSDIGIHAPESQLEVEVKVSEPTRFWSSRVTTKTVHPGDVMDRLRTMKAS